MLVGVLVPDFIVIMVVVLAFYEPGIFGAVMSFVLGLLLDMSSGLILGPRAGSSVALFGFLSSLSQRLFVESPVALVVVVFFATLLDSLIYVILLTEFQSVVTEGVPFFGWGALGEALLTAIVAPLVSWFVRFCIARRVSSLTSGGLPVR